MRKARAITFVENDQVVAGFYITEGGLKFTISDTESCHRIQISKESKLNDPKWFTAYCEELESKDYNAIAVTAHEEYSNLDCVIICGICKEIASINVHVPSLEVGLAGTWFDEFYIEWETEDGGIVEGKHKVLIQKKRKKSTRNNVRRITDYANRDQ